MSPARDPGRRRPPLRTLVALALLATGTGVWLASTSYETAPLAEVLGGNLPINAGAVDLADLSAHNSPTVARSPVDGEHLAVANRIDSPRFSCALHVSSDGGATWDRLAIPMPAIDEPTCYAADTAFGGDGTLYVSFVTLKGLANVPEAVWLTSASWSAGAGVAGPFDPPTRVLGPLAFQVRLLADPGRTDRLYITWLQAQQTAVLAFPETGNPVQITRSDDRGRTWSAPARVSDRARLRVVAPSPAVGPGGEVYVLYLDVGDDRLDYAGAHEGRGGEPYRGPWRLVLARSDDGGGGWSESVAEQALVPTERFIVFLPPSPSLAVAGDGAVYAAFTDGRAGDADVYVWRSSDRGAHWSAPVRVNDTPTGDATSQYLPKITTAAGGRLDVVYYDRRRDRPDIMNEVSLQSSFDGGRSFGPSVRLSDRSFSSRVGFGHERDLPDLGSRLGLVSTDGRAMAVWSDTRAGTEASRKQDLVRAVVDVTAPRSLPGPLAGVLAATGIVCALTGLVLLALRRDRRDGEPATSEDLT